MPSLSDPVPPPGVPPAAAHGLPSLPATQRHASFPPPPPDLAALLPPGLSLTRLGCAAEDDDHRAGPSSTLARAASESLLFGGASGGRISPPAATTTASIQPPPPPPTTRHASYGPGSELDWGLRRLSLDSSSTLAVDAKAKRERAAVREGWEDPALAAARRALWADDSDSTSIPSSNGLVGALAERSPTPRADADAAAPSPAAAPTSEERRDQEDSPEAAAAAAEEDDDGGEEAYALLLPPPACMPCHATLSPRASCLRNSPLARSTSLAALSCSTSSFSSDSSPVSLSDSAALPPPPPPDSDTPPTTTSSSRDRDLPHRRNSSSGGRLSPSATSTASTSAPPSVSFSPAPPLEGATYSAVDYERGGDGPVEKLSVREWIELQGVREAVGVWSGKIEPWSAELEAALQNAAADLGGGGGDGSTTSGKRFSSAQATSPSSCTAPAALVGVVQVTKSAHNSPVLGSVPLWR